MNKILALIMVFVFYVGGTIKAATPPKRPSTTSVIIPCHPKHSKYLYELLKVYENQTVLPDEVVIAISEAKLLDPAIMKPLNEEPWKFPVKFILSEQKLFAGQNRNVACRNATGDIFVCQDADDWPHLQRIEVIKYFFDTFNLDLLLHRFVYNSADAMSQLAKIDDISSIQHAYVKTYHEAWAVGYMHFGQPAVHRRVFDRIQWPNIPIDEDNVFDSAVITRFGKCAMIFSTLVVYRSELSATPYELYRNYFLSKNNSQFAW